MPLRLPIPAGLNLGPAQGVEQRAPRFRGCESESRFELGQSLLDPAFCEETLAVLVTGLPIGLGESGRGKDGEEDGVESGSNESHEWIMLLGV